MFVCPSSHTAKIAPSEAHFHVTEITGEQTTVHTGGTRSVARQVYISSCSLFFSFPSFYINNSPPTHPHMPVRPQDLLSRDMKIRSHQPPLFMRCHFIRQIRSYHGRGGW